MADAPGREAPLRVALVTRSLLTGGAQKQIVRLCRHVPRARVQLSLVLLVADDPQDLLPAVRETGVPVHLCPHRRHDPRTVRWLASVLDETRADLMHSFLWTADGFAALTRRLATRVALVTSERGDRSGSLYPLRRNLFDRLVTFPAARRVCANSAFGAALLERAGCPAGKIVVIPNGVSLAEIDATPHAGLRTRFRWPDERTIVGTVSRLEPYKGLEDLVRAVAGVPDVSLVLVGAGPDAGRLASLAGSLGVSDRTELLGRVDTPVREIKDLDVFVLPTREDTEHCSNSILEAMACGKPVVATRVGGNPELVVPDETGILVPPSDPAALGQAVRRLASDAALRREMGARGRARIERGFRIESTVSRFVELWESAASSPD